MAAYWYLQNLFLRPSEMLYRSHSSEETRCETDSCCRAESYFAPPSRSEILAFRKFCASYTTYSLFRYAAFAPGQWWVCFRIDRTATGCGAAARARALEQGDRARARRQRRHGQGAPTRRIPCARRAQSYGRSPRSATLPRLTCAGKRPRRPMQPVPGRRNRVGAGAADVFRPTQGG